MRILQLHCDFVEYEPVKKEIDLAEAAEEKATRVNDVVALFVSIEKGDDDTLVSTAVSDVNASLKRIGANRILVYPYSHLSSNLASPSDALRLVQNIASLFKDSGLEVYRAPFGWTKAFSLKVKGHPLAEQSKSFAPGQVAEAETVSKALKAEEKLVSTYHVLTPDGKLIPVTDFRFSDYPNLEKLAKYEMTKVRAVAEQPPHVDLMKRLGLVDYEPGSDPGNLRFYPKGRMIKSLLEQYVSSRVREYGGIEVETPIMYDMKHPALADYLHRFPARQYQIKSEDKDLFLRFSACFGQFLMAKDAQISYRHLPLRLYELTRYSFRREKSGELVGLRRLRAFTMPDCHAICANLDQAKGELLTRFQLSRSVLSDIGLGGEDYELAIRFTEDFYRENETFIKEVIKMHGRPAFVEMWKERFFYFVLKWEFNFIDNQGKASALSTDQIDVENAKRYGILFVDTDGASKYPIILHNSPSGAIERCIYALLEKAHHQLASKQVPSLPLWLTPTQIRLIPVGKEYAERAAEKAKELESYDVRVDIDDREETVGKRVREAEREWIPYIIVFGEKEASSTKITVRDRVQAGIKEMTVAELGEHVRKANQAKPFLKTPVPKMLSVRPQFTT
ncbi:MAG: threonine--tRNA ligase [Thaumarchaeota archaeon]|nr:threonine--tRNA ligase [Nitrososphaerota archaeon]